MSTSPFSLSDVLDLKGRVAVVTGGDTGVGWMIAQAFATNGVRVYITGRRKDVLEKAILTFEMQEHSGEIIPLVMDVTNKESIAMAQKEIQEKEGKVHILINNAGQIGPVSACLDEISAPKHRSPETLGQALSRNETFEEWSDLYRVNVSSIFFVTTTFLGLLIKGSETGGLYTSCVINIESLSEHTGLSQTHFAYNSSKAAVSHLTKMFATELALKKVPRKQGPEAVTHWNIALQKAGSSVTELPSDWFCRPVEMVGIVIALVGDYSNGVESVIDGGLTPKPYRTEIGRRSKQLMLLTY